MRLNYEICIIGERCVLVPYRPEHVEKYHNWMKDPALLEATGSEPLSMEEEIAMQVSWREDNNKCTFIVLAKADVVFDENPPKLGDFAFVERNLSAMVGDVNLFLSEEDIEEEEPTEISTAPVQCEIDIMIAEEPYRHHGIGREACLLMMLYGAQYIPGGIRRIFAKINATNVASKNLFEKKLRFTEKEFVAVFNQHEFELKRESNEELIEILKEQVGELNILKCPLWLT